MLRTESIPDVNINRKQKYLGEKGLLALLGLLSAFVPLSTDLYLPSLPGIAEYFRASVHLTNLTLILFFLFFSAGTLLWGPLSDKYGRKPILLIGLATYTAASALCACAGNLYLLIVFRVLQAVGGSAAGSVATAMVKDLYSGRRREAVLALVQSMVLLAPAVAPVLGAFLLKFTTWRGVFWALAGIGLLSLAGALAMEETIEHHYEGTIIQVMGRLGTVLKNPGFTSLLAVFSILGISTMAFIASSSYIYIDGFGLSEQTYSYYFALNAMGLIAGPMLYLQLSKRFSRRSIISSCFLVVALSGVLITLLGNFRPWLFALTLLPSSLAGSCVRPPGTNLMLEQQAGDAGSASSLISCFGILMGSVGMSIISIDWGNTIVALGVLTAITGLLCEALWVWTANKPFIRQVHD